MSEQQPEAVWVFPEKKKRGPRTALIVLMVVLVLIVAGVVALFLIPHGDDVPAPTASPSMSTSATPSASPAPTTAPTGEPLPTTTQTAPPPVPDPSVDAFRAQVEPRLNDATTGLDMVQSQSGDAAVQIVDSLQNDAQHLAGQPAPASIASTWGDMVSGYSAKLQVLRSAYSGGSDASGALADARAALTQLRSLVGL